MTTGLESPAYMHAVDDHQYFLGLERNISVSRQEAERDFIDNYFVPWVEEEPPVELPQVNTDEIHPSCTNNSQYNLTQVSALKKALKDHQWYLSQNNGHFIDEENAKEDFFKRHVEKWAVLFRKGYCLHVCEKRAGCCVAKKYSRNHKKDHTLAK